MRMSPATWQVTVFPSGGHLGNLHLREFQNAVSLAIRGQGASDLVSDTELESAGRPADLPEDIHGAHEHVVVDE